MSKTNYTQFSNTKTETPSVKIQNGDPKVGPEIVFNEPVQGHPDPVGEAGEPGPVGMTTVGVVDGCYMLNVRKEPNTDADVVCVIKVGATVEINEAESTDEFYKVCTAAGATGYCMKKYIKVE